jgi:hypothetical protein
MQKILQVIVSFSVIPWIFSAGALRGQALNFTTSTQVANSSSSATFVNQLACWESGSSIATKVATNCGTSPGNGTIIGVVSGGAGTSGSANIIQSGVAQCLFSNTVSSVGDYVIPSSGMAGECYDEGTSNSLGTQMVGVVLAVPSSGSLANILLFSTVASPGAVSISAAPVTTGPAQLYMTSPIGDPAQPTSVTNAGTTGTTAYGYEVVAAVGCCTTAASPEKQTATGNATLTTTNYNTVNWAPVAATTTGAVTYDVYRTTSAGTPSSLGLIGTGVTCSTSCSFNDTGIAASASATPPSVNATGYAGIGTATPQRPFEVHVNEPGEASGLLLQNDNTVVGAGGGLIISVGPVSSPVELGGLHAVSTATSNSMSLWEYYGGVPDNLVTLTGGNVGIGDAAPASLLSVGASSQFQVNSSGVAVSYDGLSTAGLGLSPTVASPTRQTGLTSSISSTTLCTTSACPTGLYQVTYYLVCTTAGTGGTVDVSIGWNDGSASHSVTSSTATLGTLGGYAQGTLTLYSASGSGTAFTYSTTFSPSGSPVYALSLNVQKLQ